MPSIPVSTRRAESGVALLLTLLIFLILAAIVSELVITSRLDYQVAKNDSNLARMDLAVESALQDALDLLRQDAEADAGAAGGPSQTGGAAAGGASGGGAPGAPGDAAAGPSDSREDEWAKTFDKTLGDVRVSVYIEDENRKFNLLCLLSPDEDFAAKSKERLARILDLFREETDRDLDSFQAEALAAAIQNFLKGGERPSGIPRPALLTDQPNDLRTPPLTLDELLFVDGLTEDLLYDREEEAGADSEEKRIYPGLLSMLTVWTSIQPMPTAQPGGSGAASTTGSGDAGGATASGAGAQGASGGAAPGSGPVGVRLNVNTAPRAVLKALFPSNEFPPDVVEALIRYRNLEREESEETEDTTGVATDTITGEEIRPMQFFASLDDLEKAPEFQNYLDPKPKEELKKLLGVQSDVFSIYLTARMVDAEGGGGVSASGEPGEEEDEGRLVRRVRAVFWRRQGDSGLELLPIVRWEVRADKKLVLRDFPPEEMPLR